MSATEDIARYAAQFDADIVEAASLAVEDFSAHLQNAADYFGLSGTVTEEEDHAILAFASEMALAHS